MLAAVPRVRAEMMNIWFRNFTLLILMLAASGLALALRPTVKISAEGRIVDFETIIPHAFGEWRKSPRIRYESSIHSSNS